MRTRGAPAATVVGIGPAGTASGAVSPPADPARGARLWWGFATVEGGTSPVIVWTATRSWAAVNWRCLRGWAADGHPYLLAVRGQALGSLLLRDNGRELRGGLRALSLQPQARSAGRRPSRGARACKEHSEREAGWMPHRGDRTPCGTVVKAARRRRCQQVLGDGVASFWFGERLLVGSAETKAGAS
jgi:hypothetical protein